MIVDLLVISVSVAVLVFVAFAVRQGEISPRLFVGPHRRDKQPVLFWSSVAFLVAVSLWWLVISLLHLLR